MTTRQWVIRLLLISLGIGAFGGAVGILFGGDTLTWQIIGSAITLSIGCMFFQVCNGLSRRDHGYHAGLLGMGLVGVEFFIMLLLIWLGDFSLFGSSNDFWELLVYNALALPMTGSLAMTGLYLQHKPALRTASRLTWCVTAISQLLFMIASIAESYDVQNQIGSSANWWMTGWSLLGYGLLIAVMMAGRFRGYKIIGLAAAIVSVIMLILGIWVGSSDYPEFFAAATIIAMAFAHGNAIWMLNLKPGAQQTTRRAVQMLALVVASLALITVICVTINLPEDIPLRLAGALGFILVCGTFGLMVIHTANLRKNRHRPVDESELVYKALVLTCPHCQTQQTLPVGQSHCSTCSMGFGIKIDEPHCPQCDYLLVHNQSETCPECGSAVKQRI